jgi:hypothetical protein
MRPTAVLGAFLAFAGLLACATTGPQAREDVRFFPGTDFTGAVAAVLDAVAGMDARVLSATADEGAGVAHLLVLPEWRAPEAESAVLRIELSRADETMRVAVTAEALGTLFERSTEPRPQDAPEILPPGTCKPCEDQLDRREFTGRGNARVLANMQRARRAFLEAWDRRPR